MPNQIDKLLGSVGLVRKSALTASSGPVSLLGTTLDGLSAKRAMELFNGWTYACIRAIAEELANIEFELYRAGKKNDERIWDHEILDLLEGVNPQQTGYDLRYLLGAYLEAAGNNYWYLEGVEKPGQQARAIYPLNAGNVTVEIDRENFPSRITGYRMTENGKVYRFQPHQILHIKYPNPSNNHQGLGTVQAIARWIEADNFAAEFNRNFFINGARMGHVIESEATNQAQLEVLRKSIEAVHKGVENAYRMVILPKGAKFGSQQEVGIKDMDFANLMLSMRDKILAGFRVPRTVLGITDDVNRANAEATHYVFMARTIVPKMRMITAYLNEFLVPHYGPDLYLSFKDPTPENREATMNELSKATGGQPVMSVNEARDRYFGLDPVDGGDEVMSSGLMTPIGAPIPRAESMNESRTSSHKKGKPTTKGARARKAKDGIIEELVRAAAEEVKKSEKQIAATLKKKTIADLTDDEFEPIYKKVSTRVSRYEKLLTEKMQDLNAKQEKEILGNLAKLDIQKAIKRKGIDPEELLDRKQAVKATVKLAGPIYFDLFEKEAAAAAALVGSSFEMTNLLKEAIDHAVLNMANSYTETTLNQLKAKLEEALAAGASEDQIIDTIQGIREFADETRAAQVARTETYRVANDGAKEAWKQSGVVREIKWYTAADERVCEFCGPMHGKTVDIEENFFDKGDTVEGSDGGTLDIEYDDVRAGSLHVQCRCYTRPVKITPQN